MSPSARLPTDRQNTVAATTGITPRGMLIKGVARVLYAPHAATAAAPHQIKRPNFNIAQA